MGACSSTDVLQWRKRTSGEGPQLGQQHWSKWSARRVPQISPRTAAGDTATSEHIRSSGPLRPTPREPEPLRHEMSDIHVLADLRGRHTAGRGDFLDDGSWEVQGRRLTLPVRITDASAAWRHTSSAPRGERLVEGTGLSLVSVAAARRWSSGSSPTGPVTSTATTRSPSPCWPATAAARPLHPAVAVTESFTLEAGRALWGLPKWPARAELSLTGRAPPAASRIPSGAPCSPPRCAPCRGGSR